MTDGSTPTGWTSDRADARPAGEAGLPALLLIADGFASGRARQSAEHVGRAAAHAVAAGVSWVMLRDHAASAADFDRAAARLVERLRDIRPGLRVAVNTRVEAAVRLGAGLHVGTRGPSVAEARASVETVGVSAHTASDLEAAMRDGAAYATLSPVFATATHPEAEPLGTDAFASMRTHVPPLPVLALGGVAPDRVPACLAAGASGVAVLSGLLDAHRIAPTVSRYLSLLSHPA